MEAPSAPLAVVDGNVVRVVLWGGLGDNLMATAGMAALHERTDGEVRFDVFVHAFATMYEHLPFIRTVYQSKRRNTGNPRLFVPESTPNAITLQASQVDHPHDGQSAYAFRRLNVEDEPLEQRRMRYIVTHQERQEAFALLTEAGWRGEPLLGLQLHGWVPIKRWRHLPKLAELARRSGFFVVTLGHADPNGQGIYHTPNGPGNLVGKTPSVRHLAALQTWMSAWVGHDSGGTFLACAVDCPTVFLCGPVDVSVMMNGLGAHRHWRVVRDECARHCRVEDRPACSCEGSSQGGCSCLDAITPERVWLEVLPLLDRPDRLPFTGSLQHLKRQLGLF